MNNIHIRLTNKISILYDIISCTLYVLINEDIKPIFIEEEQNLIMIEYEYNAFIMPYVMAYFGKDNNETKLFKLRDDAFINVVKSLNIQNKLESIFNKCYPYILSIVDNEYYEKKKISVKNGQFSNYIDAIRRLVQNIIKIRYCSTHAIMIIPYVNSVK